MPRFGQPVSVAVGLVLALATPRAAFAKAVVLSCPAPGAQPDAPNETWILNFTPTDESPPERMLADVELPDGGDCAEIEIVPGLACLEDQITEWVAGIKGLCDAPYGLGIRKGDARWVLVARFKQGSRRNRLAPGDQQVGCSRPRPSRTAHVASTTAPKLTTPTAPTQPERYDVELRSPDRTMFLDLPGHLRRVDRPPRNIFFA